MHAFGATVGPTYVHGTCVFRNVITDNATRSTINFILRENRTEYWPTADTPSGLHPLPLEIITRTWHAYFPPKDRVASSAFPHSVKIFSVKTGIRVLSIYFYFHLPFTFLFCLGLIWIYNRVIPWKLSQKV